MQPLTPAQKQLVELYTPFALDYAERRFGPDPEILSAAGWAVMDVAAELATHPNPRRLVARAVAKDCLNVARDWAKYRNPSDEWWDSQTAAEPVEPGTEPERKAAVIRQVIESLPWGRVIAEKYFLDGMTIRDLAADLRIGPIRLTNLIRRLRKQIKTRAEEILQ